MANKFTSTGNQSGPHLEEDEFIEEKFERDEDSRFFVPNRGNNSSIIENDQEVGLFHKTTRLDKFKKQTRLEDDYHNEAASE